MFTLRDWQTTIKKDSKLLVSVLSPKEEKTNWPEGYFYQYHHARKTLSIPISKFQIGDHKELILLKPYEEGKDKYEEYFTAIPNYKYVCLANDNFVYETLMAGCVPVLPKEYENMKEFYGDVPMIFTDDKSNFEYLEKTYQNILSKSYNFSKLFLSSYPLQTQEAMVYNSRMWTMVLYGELWYDTKIFPISSYKLVSDKCKYFSLAIPTMDRYDKYLKNNLPKYIQNEYIREIVICDENGNDYEKIQKDFGDINKIKLFKNDKRLGPLRNKIKTMSLCSCDHIALIDSDNYADYDYFESAMTFGTCQSTILLPSYSLPRVEFTEMQIFNPINKNNWYDSVLTKNSFQKFNDGNGIYPKSFVNAISKVDLSSIEPHASDAFLIIQIAVSLDFNVCFTNSKYNHEVSEDSIWILTEKESVHFFQNWNFGLLDIYY
jgi:hypothetical protein